MNEILKVNSKTSTLEWKRKYNKLVDGVSEIPNVENAQSGTIDKVLGLNSSGKLVKGSISGGTKLYKHEIYADFSDYGGVLDVCKVHLILISPEPEFTASNFGNKIAEQKSLVLYGTQSDYSDYSGEEPEPDAVMNILSYNAYSDNLSFIGIMVSGNACSELISTPIALTDQVTPL